MKAAEAEGTLERAGEERTGKPGRPAHLYQLTAEGKERTEDLPSLAEMRTDLQVRKFARMQGLPYETARQVVERAQASG
jgi:DNA-binding PadR family transcriptional regulator